MDNGTNKILEAILLVMEDQRKKMDVHSTLLVQHSDLLQGHDAPLRSRIAPC